MMFFPTMWMLSMGITDYAVRHTLPEITEGLKAHPVTALLPDPLVAAETVHVNAPKSSKEVGTHHGVFNETIAPTPPALLLPGSFLDFLK
jgi:hypothetical protein